MKLLAVVASYGHKNDSYLARVLLEYSRLPFETRTVVLSNTKKNLGHTVEVVVGTPARDPWSLPFAHKRIFADNVNNFDLFLYSEDDMLMTDRNIRAFLHASEVLPHPHLAGFFQFEEYPDGRRFFPAVHHHFHWAPDSVRTIGNYTVAQFTNEHSACYLLTRDQLKHAIASGGFLVAPHESKYDLLVTAATDPYTQCGFKKIICLSHFEDFLVAHLPNKYVGSRMGVDGETLYKQIDRLIRDGDNNAGRRRLLQPETRVFHTQWSKDYYEPCRTDLLNLVPSGAKSVLSIGCGRGHTEAALVRKGMRVTAIPLDSVIAACAESEGVELAHGDIDSSLGQLADRRFDCVLMSNILHLLPEPMKAVERAASLLERGGVVVVAIPNTGRAPFLWRRLRHPARYKNVGKYEYSGMRCVSRAQTIRWLRRSGLGYMNTIEVIPSEWQPVVNRCGRLGARLLSAEYIVVGRKL
jgi:SAM-dependent methyltransferase